MAASNRHYFTQRYIIATNERWSENALAELQQLTPAVTLITRSMLAGSLIDWASYLKTGEVKTIARRTPHPYQKEAIGNVIEGFKTHNRGKLIMACGTGKTFTSMKIAEELQGEGGYVMFLVPSLALLSQTLSDWKRQCAIPIHAFAVCSDASTGKSDLGDIDALTSASDLSYPATTQADKLAKGVKAARAKPGMTVIFSTYQSIEVVSIAQKQYGMEDIGLIICDEAHRTSGGHYQDEDDTPFQRIHDDNFIRGNKRLYMTATPRIYGDIVKNQQQQGEVVLYSMDDETVYGPTFHTITFSQAVALGSLVDYKVIVLSVEEGILKSRDLSDYEVVSAGGLSVKHAAKAVGCWRALSKLDLQGNVSILDDLHAMRRAVGFAQIIEPNTKYLDRTSSKLFTKNFNETIQEFKSQNYETLKEENPELSREAYDLQHPLKCETRHIDGSMNATQKEALLGWLKEEPEDDVCKILFNVRCLSEGVDVPALDAVLFLSPRKSQVEVVQTVGRVMRVSPATGKKRGYVIIPIVTPAGVPADAALNNNPDFDVVWQVLNALKSIDTEFGAIVDGQRNIIDSTKIEVVCLTNKKLARKPKSDGKVIRPPKRKVKPGKATSGDESQNLSFDFNHDEILEQEIRTRIVKRVGNRREWGDWAEDVGKICQMQIKHIKDVLDNPDNTKSQKAFASFKEELKATLNDSLTEDEVIEMLGQHIVTQPILDALFTVKEGEETVYEFSRHNPIAKAMTTMIDALDKDSMKVAYKSLEEFYRSVRMRTRTIKTAADRQVLIKELFEKFFKVAFPKQQEKLGIVYTPIEVVDFINRSVADLLKKEFGTDIGEEGVHILDPFAGTGTFMARLMQSGLIAKDKLPQKFENELHANEIVPLAYYVASMNLEGIYHEICPEASYEANKVMILTDTFANNKQSDIFKTDLSENNARLAALNNQDIRVILGNPPYSVGQKNANDNNQNEHYDELDTRIANTYVTRSNSKNLRNSYDSFSRAYRWASDRIGNKGIVGFVSNASFVEVSSFDGMRKCMVEEFNSIYIYHLKGNARTQGEQRRKERDNVFGEGSRAPVAVVFLVKNPDTQEKGKIHFHAVGDYLTREEKLEALKKDGSILNTKLTEIVPDNHGDWLNFRDDTFNRFIGMVKDSRNAKEQKALFNISSLGLTTSRDPWVYNSSPKKILKQLSQAIVEYNSLLLHYDKEILNSYVPAHFKWSRSLKNKFSRKVASPTVTEEKIYKSIHRPFIFQPVYFDRFWNEYVYSLPKIFPTNTTENLLICINLNAKDSGQIALMVKDVADLHLNGDSLMLPPLDPYL